MKKITNSIAAWLRGLVWTAMILGCAWAGAQSYLIAPPGPYKIAAIAPQGAAAEGAQNVDTPKDDLFAGTEVFAKGASDITEVTMDPDSLNLVGGPDEHKAHNMVLNVVRTYTYSKPGMYNMADVDAFRSKLNTGDWHCSIHTRDLKTGAGSDICSKRRTDGMKETAIIEVEPRQLTFVHTIRRSGGPGTSDLGYFPMLPGIGPMTMMAMTNPEAFATMQIGMHDFPMMLDVEPRITMQTKELKVHPFDKEQRKRLQEQMKGLKGFYKDKEPKTPAEPATPAPQALPEPPK
jgi:hypothetical protein